MAHDFTFDLNFTKKKSFSNPLTYFISVHILQTFTLFTYVYFTLGIRNTHSK